MVQIESLGLLGDGVFKENGKDVFVPFSLPGEEVQLTGKDTRRTIASILDASDKRVEPICRHFGVCGGCQMQHAQVELYREWKKWIVKEVFERNHIDKPLDSYFPAPLGSRRRAVFSARRMNGVLELGFSKRDTNELVNLEQCPVLTASLENSIEQIRALAASLPLGKNAVHICVVDSENGLDVCIQQMREPDQALRKALVRKAAELGFARLAIEDETLIETRRPYLHMGIAQPVPNPGGFLQASREAEQVMADIVCEYLSRSKQVADLFCGIGTFALRLAERSTVWALEENAAAVASLDQAWRETAGKLKRIDAETRNLERRPLGFQELKKFDGLVFDPPRSGAELQCTQLAKSNVKKLAAVSCNPVTLARDLKILQDGGYTLVELHAIDQFLFTPHIELVALLER